MSTLEIQETFLEMYAAEVSPTLISRITDIVMEWQSRPLDTICPIVYPDGIVVKIRQNKLVIDKSVFPALDINLQVHKNCQACGG